MNHMQRYLAEEFAEDYREGRISRRQALKVLASLTGSMFLATSFLAACAPPPAESTATLAAGATTLATAGPTSAPASPTGASAAPSATNAPDATAAPTTAANATVAPTSAAGVPAHGTVVPDDPAINAGPVEFPSSGASVLGYLARPTGAGPFPVVLICHENRGLTTHIQDVARRFGKARYAALAVDLLSRQGGSAAVGESGAPGALGGIAPDQFVQDFKSGWEYLKTQTFAQAERVGMVGFCFGGGVTWLVAEDMPELKAAVPFYGPPPPVDQVPNIQAAVLAMYGALDSRITSSEPAMEAAMQQANKVFEKMIYPDADHAFFNDTGTRYNPAAAQDAWGRTVAWFGKYV